MATHHTIRSPLSEITFWSWVTAAVLVLLVFAAFFSPSGMQRVAENSAPVTNEGMMPPITQPGPVH